MKGSITIVKNLGKNTNTYLTIKYYDSWKEQVKDIDILLATFAQLGIQASHHTYIRANDVYEFARQLGYNDMNEARRAYNSCKKQSERLHRLFNSTEIDILSTIE